MSVNLSVLSNLNIGTRLSALFGFLSVLLVATGLFALYIVVDAEKNMSRLYAERMVPIERVSLVQRDTIENRILLLEAIMHTESDIKPKLEQVQFKIDAITKNWREAKKDLVSEKEKELVENYESARNSFGMGNIMPNIDALKIGDREEALMNDQMTSVEYGPVAAALADMVAYQLSSAKNEIELTGNGYARLRNIIIAMISIGLMLAAFIAWLTIKSVTRPLRKALTLANRVAEGDLTGEIKSTSEDEIGQLLKALGAMNSRLHDVVKSVQESGVSIHGGATEIAAGSLNLSQRTEEQASSLEETAASMEEMTSTVKQSTENTQMAHELAEAAREEAKEGALAVTNTIGAMEEIEESSKKIADIISVIDDIAFQTNLLALNAAVEAARAGEQGRGFAVVATEVRNLAQRSAGAAKEIKDLIGESVERVKNGSDMVENSGEALAGIVGSVNKVNDIIAEISAASKEQSSGIDQVNKAIAQMDTATQQNAALVEESAAASHAMEEQANMLAKLMDYFKLSTSDFYKQPQSGEEAAQGADIVPLVIKTESPENTDRKSKSEKGARRTGTSDDEWEEF